MAKPYPRAASFRSLLLPYAGHVTGTHRNGVPPGLAEFILTESEQVRSGATWCGGA